MSGRWQAPTAAPAAVVPAPQAPPEPAREPRPRSPLLVARTVVLILTVIVGCLVLYPIVMLLIGSVAPDGAAGGFTLDGYRTALTDEAARDAAWTTIWLSFVRAVLAVAVAVFLAWAITRTDMPGSRFFHRLMLLNFFFPTLPMVLAWIILLSPRSGTINVWLRDLLGIDARTGPFDIFSYYGIIFVGVMTWCSFLYLLIVPAFRAVDPTLEEAARMAGASNLRTIRRVTVPLLWPAVLGAFGLAFVRMAESFETEQLLGVPADIYVFSTQIYRYIGQDVGPQYGPAIALSTLFVVLIIVLLVLQNLILRGRSFVTVTGKDYRARRIRLRAAKYPVLALVILFNILSIFLPTAFLLLASLQRTVSRLSMDGFTRRHWQILNRPAIWQSLVNTVVVGVVAATVCIALVTVVSYVVIRSRFRVRHTLDALTWVPYMVPSFVLGVGFLWVALRGIPLPFVLYGSLTLLIIAFIVRLIPLGSRLMNGTTVQLSTELEEAARMSGASWPTAFRRVVLPLLVPAIGIGWLMFMAVVIRDLSTVILLTGPETQLLSVRFFSYWRTASLESAAVIGLLMTLLGLGLATGIFLLQRLSKTSVERSIV
jgi:iron(III) transport system permease protein